MPTSEIVADIVKRAAPVPLHGHITAGMTRGAVGDAAVDIRIVPEGDSDIPHGDAILDAMVDVHRALRTAGEERTAMVTFADEAELATYVDP